MSKDKIDYTLERQKDKEIGRKAYEESAAKCRKALREQARKVGKKLTQAEILAYREARKH